MSLGLDPGQDINSNNLTLWPRNIFDAGTDFISDQLITIINLLPIKLLEKQRITSVECMINYLMEVSLDMECDLIEQDFFFRF